MVTSFRKGISCYEYHVYLGLIVPHCGQTSVSETIAPQSLQDWTNGRVIL
jgi:hypothetical protein